jgi:hypothetical protein
MHLIKLGVGIDTLDQLRASMAMRSASVGSGGTSVSIHTRQMPRQASALLDGGSLYWVIKGMIAARQRLIDIHPERDASGREVCALVLDAVVVPVLPRPRRPFQGWRYLPDEEAPGDLRAGDGPDAMPADMRAALAELALL